MSRKNEIEGCIATAGLRAAVGRFIDLSRELGNFTNAPLLFSSRFYTIDDNERNKKKTKEEIVVDKTELSDHLLSSLRDFVDDALQDLLKDKVEYCKKSINNNLEEGYNSLLEVASTYASEKLEQDLFALGDKVKSKQLSKEKLAEYADLILQDYKLRNVEYRFYKKQAKDEVLLTLISNDLVVTADNLVKNYNSSGFHLKADNIELRLGEITGLVGENATGKTTLLSILAGELAPQSGVVNYPLFDPKGRKDWTDLKMRIAYVPQELTAWEGSLLMNLAFEAARHGIKGEKNKAAVDFIIQRLGLALHTDKSWAELSGGYKLRFALAKALVWQPQLLILDEPLAYLDIKTQSIVLSDLRNLAKSLKNPLAILISSQHLHETESVADQMWFMRDGELENLGSTKDFNRDRNYNLFELSCALPFTAFHQRLNDLGGIKTWQSDQIYFIKTPLSILADNLLDECKAKGIKLLYFRDISQSVKTKFYEDTL